MAVKIADHPLVRHKLGILRAQATTTSEFRRVANELAMLLTYEASRHFQTEKRLVEGWKGTVETDELAGKKLTIVPILRAGLGMMDGVLAMLPAAKISVVGLYRNEKTLEPVEYYIKLAKDIRHRAAFILDPMLATGGSMLATIAILKKHGCSNISSLNLVCSRAGVEAVQAAHPDVDIYTAAIDGQLDSRGYILPGLGDAGDRIFGTQ